ncbi:hypothetical protein GC170_22445 [bacterium]|nr:hypothetical protein [bacterium]
MTRFVLRFAVCIALTTLVGCRGGGLGSVRVVKNPDDGDNGIRYYRPKPYLLVEPADPLGRMVKLKVEQLPDYSEEYSIHTRGRAAVQLKDGWNLVSAGPGGGGGGGGDEKKEDAPPPAGGDPAKMPEMVVAANNVPIGYYESVFDTVGTKKYLKGWRYIGFAVNGGGSPMGVQQGQPGMPGGPDPNCPQPPPPSSVNGPLYGLVFFNGVMTFREIGEIAGNLMCPTYVMTPKPPGAENNMPDSPRRSGVLDDTGPSDSGLSEDKAEPEKVEIKNPVPPKPSTPGPFSPSTDPDATSHVPSSFDRGISRTMAPRVPHANPAKAESLIKASESTGIPLPKDL